jgi:hypothetical protein
MTKDKQKHAPVNSMSGRTDIAGCFGLGNALTAVSSGGCSSLTLGTPVEVYVSEIHKGNTTRSSVPGGTPVELWQRQRFLAYQLVSVVQEQPGSITKLSFGVDRPDR